MVRMTLNNYSYAGGHQSSALAAGKVGDAEGRTGPGQLSFGHLIKQAPKAG